MLCNQTWIIMHDFWLYHVGLSKILKIVTYLIFFLKISNFHNSSLNIGIKYVELIDNMIYPVGFLWLYVFYTGKKFILQPVLLTSVPKPLKFSHPHYGNLQAHYEKMTDSDLKKLLAGILYVLALTISPEGERGEETSIDDLMVLVVQIVAFHISIMLIPRQLIF